MQDALLTANQFGDALGTIIFIVTQLLAFQLLRITCKAAGKEYYNGCIIVLKLAFHLTKVNLQSCRGFKIKVSIS